MYTYVDTKTIEQAAKRLKGVIKETPLEYNKHLSQLYKARIYIKREDLQEVRSYKIRGAYNLMSSLSAQEKKRGVVTASAGNHAQGVAASSQLLKIKAHIFMPIVTPLQKIDRVKHFGGHWVTIHLIGQTFDESNQAAQEFCEKNKAVYVHPFDDIRTICGQGTIGKEIYDRLGNNVDYLISPIGGGGLLSGTGTYLAAKIKKIKIIGVQPRGAPAMHNSVREKEIVTLTDIDTFVDGAAVKTVGHNTFAIISQIVDDIVLIEEGKVCTTMIELYQNEGIVAEPAGALSLSSLDSLAKVIRGKTVVCILSGGNNDILRYPEIMEKSLIYLGLKHYFLIEFAQKPGQLKNFLNKVLGPRDDIVLFEYIKKTNKERGPALIGIELKNKNDFEPLLKRMGEIGLSFTILKSDDLLYRFLV